MAVGEKVGVGSLRRSMVNQNLAQLDFDLGVPGESFGQQESLTRRLKHILQMYPEGPRWAFSKEEGTGDRGCSSFARRVTLASPSWGRDHPRSTRSCRVGVDAEQEGWGHGCRRGKAVRYVAFRYLWGGELEGVRRRGAWVLVACTVPYPAVASS